MALTCSAHRRTPAATCLTVDSACGAGDDHPMSSGVPTTPPSTGSASTGYALTREDDRRVPVIGRWAATPIRAVTPVAAAGLVASYLLSWPLWSVRESPPNLPVLDALNLVDLGVPLVAAALLAIVLPRLGAGLHTGLLVLALLGDQIRLQPGIVSLGLLLVVGAWPERLQTIGRWHLGTLWFWAGLHKALSVGWPGGAAAFIAGSMGSPGLQGAVAVGVPALEMGMGLLALWPRAWRVLRVLAPLFHIATVAVLAAASWNSVVWPWNLALAGAAALLFRSPRAARTEEEAEQEEGPAERADAPQDARRRRSLANAAAAVLLTLYPAGFYAGWIDAYLAHNLYTSNTAEAVWCSGTLGGCQAAFSTWDDLNVPFPPERRLFKAWFDRECAEGDVLRIQGINTRLGPRETSELPCE